MESSAETHCQPPLAAWNFNGTSSVKEDIERLLYQASNQSSTIQNLITISDCQQLRRVLTIDPKHQKNNLTTSTLSGAGIISIDPYVYISDSEGKLAALYHLGKNLAGHAGICHGGLPAILLDECMGRACFSQLPSQIGATVKLELNYCAPIPLDSIILICASVDRVEGRKAWVRATVEDPQDGKIFVRASAMFVEPKWAAEMSRVI